LDESEVGMPATNDSQKRQDAIHLLRSGLSAADVAEKLQASPAWVYKWRRRFLEHQDWASLQDRSRAPQHHANELPVEVRRAICEIRSLLESEARQPGHLSYIGARAIRERYKKKQPGLRVPSIASIERIIAAAGMTHPSQPALDEIDYPHLRASEPHQLLQVDIVPHFLPGGPCVSCFNAIDVVSRYPAGAQYLSKHSQEAVDFLVQVWHELGIPDYTQVDNESCFSGGYTHPGVLGKVLRLGLFVGTELLFSPVRHPESNGFIERFHQDYNQNVWHKYELLDLASVQQRSQPFFEMYRQSRHHSALQGRCPAELHLCRPGRQLPQPFSLPERLPLTQGQVHFLRAVNAEGHISLLNLSWPVPKAQPKQGVWATLSFTVKGARLRIYDAAPDAPKRFCLAEYPFVLNEPVLPLRPEFQRPAATTPSLLDLALAVVGAVAYALAPG
jgi:hypothetical protein